MPGLEEQFAKITHADLLPAEATDDLWASTGSREPSCRPTRQADYQG